MKSPFQNNDTGGGREEAVELIRARIRSLYGKQKPVDPKSLLIDRFWKEHADHPHPQTAWQQFYTGLSDTEKHSLWNDYHVAATYTQNEKNPLLKNLGTEDEAPKTPTPINNDASHAADLNANTKTKTSRVERIKKLKNRDSLKQTKENLIGNLKNMPDIRTNKTPPVAGSKSSKKHWAPLALSLSVMSLWLLMQYNPLLLALAKQYVSPGDTLRSPVIVDPSAQIEVGDDSRIIIPKINVDVPVVYDLGTRDEKSIQDALEDGVVHYEGTSKPGQAGNNVIVGHSSNNFLNSGKYKFAFVLLDRLELNDTFIMHHKGIRYVYKVTNKQVVQPTDFSLTLPTSTPTTTLITCTPPGTSWRRLIIQAEQISPTLTTAQNNPANIPASAVETPVDAIVPGNSPSLWQRFTDWIF